MLKPGKYTAKAIGGLFTESKEKKTPCVAILFQFDQGTKEQPDVQKEWWTGWMSPNALERTIETLVLIGYDDTKGNLPDGTIPETYFDGSEVQITVEDEPWQNEKGETKSSMKIKWVNAIGGERFAKIEPQAISAMLLNANLKAEMAAARAKLGVKTKPALKNHAPGAKNPPVFNTDDSPVPF